MTKSHFVLSRSKIALVSAAIALPCAPLTAAVSFEKEILPFFKERCLDCHQATRIENGKEKKPKADLRLDAPWAIMKGGENGSVLTPKDSSKSSLYEVVTLPSDDDLHMPPKGDPLTPEQIKLLKQWIDEGADFGGWEGSSEGKPADAFAGAKSVAKPREHDELFKRLSAEVKPLPEAVTKKTAEAGAQVFALQVSSPLVRVDFLTGVTQCSDEKITALLPLKEHIAQLDLGRTKITDAALATVAQFPRLVNLDLRQTAISDKGIESLTKLKNLRSLNLYGTAVTDAGLKNLAAMKSLRNVYLWQSKATEAGAKQLASALKDAKIVFK